MMSFWGRKKWLLITGVIFIVVAGAGVGVWYLYAVSHQPAIPSAIQALAVSNGSNIYYPKPLPAEITVDSHGTAASNGVASYTLLYHKQRIVVTEQPKPKGVVFDDFYNRVLQQKADVFNRAGKAVIGVAGGKTIGSLVTSDTWVLVNAPLDIDSATITSLVANLQSVR